MQRELSKKQLAVIEELFIGQFSEQEILARHNVSESLYRKWQTNEKFTRQFEQRIERAVQNSRLIIARYAPLAASKLVQLTESENQETARKACLDIISMGSPDNRNPQAGLGAKCSDSDAPPQLSDETVSRLLAALAKAPEPA